VYVRDLEQGCLLKPDPEYFWQIMPLVGESKLKTGSPWAMAYNELKQAGITRHGSVTFANSRFQKLADEVEEIGIYLGVKMLQNYYFGVKKQHMILVGSELFVIDGYSFDKVQKIE